MPKETKTTKSWNDLEEAIEGTAARKMTALLITMDDDEFVKNYIKLLEFFKPKIQRKEIVELEILNRTITYEYIESQSDKDESQS